MARFRDRSRIETRFEFIQETDPLLANILRARLGPAVEAPGATVAHADAERALSARQLLRFERIAAAEAYLGRLSVVHTAVLTGGFLLTLGLAVLAVSATFTLAVGVMALGAFGLYLHFDLSVSQMEKVDRELRASMMALEASVSRMKPMRVGVRR